MNGSQNKSLYNSRDNVLKDMKFGENQYLRTEEEKQYLSGGEE